MNASRILPVMGARACRSTSPNATVLRKARRRSAKAGWARSAVFLVRHRALLVRLEVNRTPGGPSRRSRFKISRFFRSAPRRSKPGVSMNPGRRSAPRRGGNARTPGADILVAVQVRAQPGLRIIEVNGAQMAQADGAVESPQRPRHALHRADVEACREEVRGIQADAEARGALHRAREGGR